MSKIKNIGALVGVFVAAASVGAFSHDFNESHEYRATHGGESYDATEHKELLLSNNNKLPDALQFVKGVGVVGMMVADLANGPKQPKL